MHSIDDYRNDAVNDLFRSETFKSAWSIWQPQIWKLTDSMTDPKKVFDLGSNISKIFLSTGEAGRAQGALSAAGNVWESLICWYLNVVFSGTNAIAIKQKKNLIPSAISDAATINYGTDQTNTESDLVVIVFPHDLIFPVDGMTVKNLSDYISSMMHRLEMGIIQCKTNWNDNAQIPMLWDMIYRAKGFTDHSISIGRNGHSITDMKKFTYSFVTVPTQSKTIKNTDMAVKRVRNLSGGNYWGQPSKNGVAFSLSEIFNRNFRSAFGTTAIQVSLAEAISKKKGLFELI